MVYEFLGLLVESYGTWLLLQRLVDASKDSNIPKNVPFAFAINNQNTERDANAHLAERETRSWSSCTTQSGANATLADTVILTRTMR